MFSIYLDNISAMKNSLNMGLIPLYPDLDSFKFISVSNGIHSFSYDKFENTAFRDNEMILLY